MIVLCYNFHVLSLSVNSVHLSSLEQSEYPKHTPLLAKILEGLVSEGNAEDKIFHNQEVCCIAII